MLQNLSTKSLVTSAIADGLAKGLAIRKAEKEAAAAEADAA